MNFDVCDFSRFAVTNWRLGRWRLRFLALITATLYDDIIVSLSRLQQHENSVR